MTKEGGHGIIRRNKAERFSALTLPHCEQALIFFFSLIEENYVCGEFPRIFAFLINFWRCIFISTKETPINEEIRAKEIRVVGPEGEQLGIMSSDNALKIAYDQGLDLVMMAAQAEPPVCRIMDYGKYRFDREKREKEARKKQQTVELKEVQLSCRIDKHDFETKVNHALRFLSAGNKVRCVVKFRGREMSHMEIGKEILERFAESVSEYGSVDKKPSTEGRFMSMIIVPLKPGK